MTLDKYIFVYIEQWNLSKAGSATFTEIVVVKIGSKAQPFDENSDLIESTFVLWFIFFYFCIFSLSAIRATFFHGL